MGVTNAANGKCQICSRLVPVGSNGRPDPHQQGSDPCYGSRMAALPAAADNSSPPTPRATPGQQPQTRVVTASPAVRTLEPKQTTRAKQVHEDAPPGARVLTVGLALIFGSGFFLVIGFMRWLDYTLGGSEGSGTFWIFTGSLIQLAGYVAVAIGISRFARRADAAYSFLREKHEDWRERRA